MFVSFVKIKHPDPPVRASFSIENLLPFDKRWFMAWEPCAYPLSAKVYSAIGAGDLAL